jgi:hypothetical protein
MRRKQPVHHAYLFEAKSIQGYILATNRLKEIVGASELVASLTDSLLDDALASLGVDDGRVRFSRRGGGAFFAFSDDAEVIDRLATLWPLLVRQYAPDLAFVQARGQGESDLAAYRAARKALFADRSRLPARLPQAGPHAIRSRRTGEPAGAWAYKKGDAQPEPVDLATRRKLDFARGGRLGRRFAPSDAWDAWPLNLSPQDREMETADEEGQGNERDFPFPDERRYVAVVHADGNRLGQTLMDLEGAAAERPADFVDIFRDFSEAVTGATCRAAEHATTQVLGPHREDGVYPARPIVLGGDDLTLIVRADLALAFARTFLAAFAAESEAALAPVRQRYALDDEVLPTRLTACAGLAYAKASQPFHMTHGLAEGLCKHAKSLAKQGRDPKEEVPGALSLHRVTTALVDDYREVLDRELTGPRGADGVRLRQSLECYALEGGGGLPALDDLLALTRLLASAALARGPARELLGLAGRDPDQAERRYRRWREVMGDRVRDARDEFDGHMQALLGASPGDDLPFGAPDEDGLRPSPLGDVNTLMAIGAV